MKSILILAATLAAFAACVPDNYPVTQPADSQLCRMDGDCPGTQYCGFAPGYSAAVCRGGSGGDSWGNRTATGFRLNTR